MNIFAASHLLPVSSPPLEGGAVAVENGRIVAVGKLSDLTNDYRAQVTEFPGCAIMPGMVNAHSHLELTHFPSWKLRKGIDYSPRTYTDWIIQVIKIRRALTLTEREHSVSEGLRISLDSGTTAVGEILSDYELLPCYLDSPLAGRVFFELIGQDPLRFAGMLSAVSNRLAQFAGSGFQPGLSPHAPYTVSAELFQQAGEMASRELLPMAVHLAESREELDFLFDSSGPVAEKLYPFVDWKDFLPPPRRVTPVNFLDGLGMLRADTLAIHCVHVSPAEVELLKKRGARVVLCPRSNDRLDVGKAPVRRLKKAGIPLALGTDSLASNDSLSMLDEARFLLQEFPDEFTHAEVFEMITIGGASVIGMAEQVGTLEAGKRGDFLVIELPEHPGRDLYEAVIERGTLREVFLQGNLWT